MPTTVLNPTAGDVHVNRPLTNFSQQWLNETTAYISLRAMPNLPVVKQSDLYWEYSIGDFFRTQAAVRKDGTETRGISHNLSTEPYFAPVVGVHEDVGDQMRANSDDGITPDRDASEHVMEDLMIYREAQFASAYMSANVWYNGGTSASAGEDVNWTDSSSDPIRNVRNAITGVHRITGKRPNKMVIDRPGFDALKDNDEILSRITGGATMAQPAEVQRQLIAALFELDEIFVMDAIQNTAVEGADDSFGFMGNDNALLYYAPDRVGQRTPSAGVQFSWTGYMGATANGMRIRRFRMEPRSADRVEGEMAFTYKVTSPQMGHLFTSVSS